MNRQTTEKRNNRPPPTPEERHGTEQGGTKASPGATRQNRPYDQKNPGTVKPNGTNPGNAKPGAANPPPKKTAVPGAARPSRPAPPADAVRKKTNRVRVEKDFVKTTDIVRIKGEIDRPMFIIIILLLCFGSIMVFSASYPTALKDYGDSYYYIKRQLLFSTLGIAAMIAASNFDYRWIHKLAIPAFVVTSVLLAVTPVIGRARGTAIRWLEIGPISFQPSELMKLTLVLVLAYYFAHYQKYITDYSNFIKSSVYNLFIPAAITGFVCVLIAFESHFSCMIIMFLIGMVVSFSGGARKIWFAVAGMVAGALAIFAISFSEYARGRIDIWLHPENFSGQNETWQTVQGLIAVGSGGFFGVGLGNSRQKQLFIPEVQNDFIFSIICEELGFVGAIAVIILFLAFIWRGFVIALRAPDTFSSLIVVGIVGKVAIQAVLNMMVVTAMIPNTGISLPFFSYGGTALAMQLGEMGIILGISRYTYENG